MKQVYENEIKAIELKMDKQKAHLEMLKEKLEALKKPKSKDGVYTEMPEVGDKVHYRTENGQVWGHAHKGIETEFAKSLLKRGKLFSTSEALDNDDLRDEFWHDMLCQEGASGGIKEQGVALCLNRTNDKLLTTMHGYNKFSIPVMFETKERAENALSFAKEKYTPEQLKIIFMGV